MTAVLRSPSRRICDESTLVLEALGIAFERVREDGLWVLRVAPEDAARASAELVAYLREDPLNARGLVAPARRGRPWPGALTYAAVTVLVYALADGAVGGIHWYRAGLLDATAFRGGEWWRAATALTLHAGMGHLASNLVFGAFFGALLAEACGNGVAWAIVALSGFLGNVANVLVRSGEHRAVGASTAIFGALGALAAHEWARGWTDAADVARRWAPLVGGFILLGMLGAGGENTDVVAHATGFASGLLLGVLAARSRWLQRAGRATQRVLAATACAGLAVAWALAVRGA